MSSTQVLARVRALEAARAASAARAALTTYSAAEMATRAHWLYDRADPLAPMTPTSRRACRVFALLTAALDRREAHLREIARDEPDQG